MYYTLLQRFIDFIWIIIGSKICFRSKGRTINFFTESFSYRPAEESLNLIILYPCWNTWKLFEKKIKINLVGYSHIQRQDFISTVVDVSFRYELSGQSVSMTQFFQETKIYYEALRWCWIPINSKRILKMYVQSIGLPKYI